MSYLIRTWRCGYCQALPSFDSLSGLASHMQNVHRIYLNWVER